MKKKNCSWSESNSVDSALSPVANHYTIQALYIASICAIIAPGWLCGNAHQPQDCSQPRFLLPTLLPSHYHHSHRCR